MINFIVSIPAILIVLLAVLFGLLRKTVKSALKLGSVLLAFFLAIPVSAIVVKAAYKPIEVLIYSLLESKGITAEAILSMPTLAATPEALASAFARPIVFLLAFILLLLLCLIAYAILKRVFKGKGEAIPANRVFGALIGLLVGAVLVIGFYTPVFGYVNAVNEIGITQDDIAPITDADVSVYLELVDDLNSAPAVSMSRKLGGGALFDALSTVSVGDEKAPLKDELSVIAKTALKANAFIGVKPEQYGEAQKAA
ncbi:MAG: CvpA family protein, partial [Clostridia bacterium]|nr:CvpA family protein [Clostridia bacterium]